MPVERSSKGRERIAIPQKSVAICNCDSQSSPRPSRTSAGRHKYGCANAIAAWLHEANMRPRSVTGFPVGSCVVNSYLRLGVQGLGADQAYDHTYGQGPCQSSHDALHWMPPYLDGWYTLFLLAWRVFSWFFLPRPWRRYGRNAGYPTSPVQTRTCSLPASGSSVALASVQTVTVSRDPLLARARREVGSSDSGPTWPG